jgi:hypothetical protein
MNSFFKDLKVPPDEARIEGTLGDSKIGDYLGLEFESIRRRCGWTCRSWN